MSPGWVAKKYKTCISKILKVDSGSISQIYITVLYCITLKQGIILFLDTVNTVNVCSILGLSQNWRPCQKKSVDFIWNWSISKFVVSGNFGLTLCPHLDVANPPAVLSLRSMALEDEVNWCCDCGDECVMVSWTFLWVFQRVQMGAQCTSQSWKWGPTKESSDFLCWMRVASIISKNFGIPYFRHTEIQMQPRFEIPTDAVWANWNHSCIGANHHPGQPWNMWSCDIKPPFDDVAWRGCSPPFHGRKFVLVEIHHISSNLVIYLYTKIFSIITNRCRSCSINRATKF